ncbi:MAG TPA: hypothetical protein VIK54_12040 [Acidimicrobiia bacterium]
MKMNLAVRSNLIAGVIAAIIWIVIAAVTGGGIRTVIIGGVILGVITFAVSFLITQVIALFKSGSATNNRRR